MIASVALIALALVAHQPQHSRVGQRIDFPPEIFPAVQPYFMCMMTDEQQRLDGVSSVETARAAAELLKTDCRALRDEAERRSREMLRSSRVPVSEREPLIINTLTSIDRLPDRIAEHLDQVNARRARTED